MTSIDTEQFVATIRRIAKLGLQRERVAQSVQLTALVHSVLVPFLERSQIGEAIEGIWDDEQHLYRTLSLAVRNKLIDYARARKKRGSAVPFDPAAHGFGDPVRACTENPEEMIALDDCGYQKPCTRLQARFRAGTRIESGPFASAIQDVVMPWITLLLALINALLADRSRLAVENVALRQQLAVLQRSVKRAKIDDSDRVFWILMRRCSTAGATRC